MQSSYRTMIRQTFDERVRANPNYSMRSFARDLGLAPSTLSEVLKGRKGLSSQRSLFIAKAMRLPDWQANYFRDLVVKAHSRNKVEKKAAMRRLKDGQPELVVQHIKSDTIKSLCSWLDLAILECVGLRNFQGSTEWLSKALDTSEEEVRSAVKRLQSVGLLKIHDSNRWEDMSPFLTTTDGVPSESIQTFHRNVLRTFEKKLSDTGIDKRVMKSVVFSLEENQVQEAKNILDDAISKIMSLASKAKEQKDHVMCFSSQLFFLSNVREPKI